MHKQSAITYNTRILVLDTIICMAPLARHGLESLVRGKCQQAQGLGPWAGGPKLRLTQMHRMAISYHCKNSVWHRPGIANLKKWSNRCPAMMQPSHGSLYFIQVVARPPAKPRGPQDMS